MPKKLRMCAQRRLGALIELEVQMAPDAGFDRGTVYYYWARLVTEQRTKSQGYWERHLTVTITALDLAVEPEPRSRVSTFIESNDI